MPEIPSLSFPPRRPGLQCHTTPKEPMLMHKGSGGLEQTPTSVLCHSDRARCTPPGNTQPTEREQCDRSLKPSAAPSDHARRDHDDHLDQQIPYPPSLESRSGIHHARTHLHVRRENGALVALEETPFSTENELQVLIAEHPELLDGEQMRPGDARRWILITREKGIAASSGEATKWAVDHLIIDQDGVPTLAELKRGSNSDIRRKIVGQLLEYAAHASETWTAKELRDTFERKAAEQGRDARDELATLLQTDGEPDVVGFLGACVHEPCGESSASAVRRRRHTRSSRTGGRVPQRADAGHRGSGS